MLLLESNQTELRTARVTDGLVLIMKKGQLSVSLVVNPKELDKIIQNLNLERFHIEEARARDPKVPLHEWKKKIMKKFEGKL